MPSKQYIPVSSALPQCLPNSACESKCQQSDTSPTCSNSSQIKSKAISSLGDINFNVILHVAGNRPKLGKHKHVPMRTFEFSENSKRMCDKHLLASLPSGNLSSKHITKFISTLKCSTSQHFAT